MPQRPFLIATAFAAGLVSLSHAAPRPLEWVAEDFEVLMRTHGQITFAPYVNGGSPEDGSTPGYRSEFYAYVDFFSWKGLVSNWLIANSTVIDRSDTSMFRLNRIRYTLTPGYRYEFDTWQISGLLLHECIHAIGKQEENGSIWWNSFRFGFGSKGAYQQFLVERYREDDFSKFLDKWDYQVNAGVFLYGDNSVWLAQNSTYRYEGFSLLRYHLGRWGRWGSYADLNQAAWFREDGETEQKWSATLNLLLRGRVNLAALYYTYFFYDTNTQDNENQLGALGFKIVF
jgi:hypothetical protein